ncbi:MAG: hypothetical protein ACHQQR_14270, partial [Gemmatimonadales bacterium]
GESPRTLRRRLAAGRRLQREYQEACHAFVTPNLRLVVLIAKRYGARDEQLVGVLYLLGYVNESLGKPAEAKSFYERVFGVDIQFRDVGDRLNAVDKALAT